LQKLLEDELNYLNSIIIYNPKKFHDFILLVRLVILLVELDDLIYNGRGVVDM
jgi:hypothetical protein